MTLNCTLNKIADATQAVVAEDASAKATNVPNHKKGSFFKGVLERMTYREPKFGALRALPEGKFCVVYINSLANQALLEMYPTASDWSHPELHTLLTAACQHSVKKQCYKQSKTLWINTKLFMNMIYGMLRLTVIRNREKDLIPDNFQVSRQFNDTYFKATVSTIVARTVAKSGQADKLMLIYDDCLLFNCSESDLNIELLEDRLIELGDESQVELMKRRYTGERRTTK